MRPETKMPFLAVHDYGTGGLWVVIDARSADEITRAYPELQILPRPAWMTDSEYARIEHTSRYDIDSPGGWLAQLVDSRTPSAIARARYPSQSSLPMSIPCNAPSVLEIHCANSATVEWQGWLAHEDGVIAIAGIFPESPDAPTSYVAWRFGPHGAHTPVPITVQRPLMRILSAARSWAPATFLCDGCTHGTLLPQRWGAVRFDGSEVVAAPFAEHVPCSGDVTFSETAGGRTVDVITSDPPRVAGEPPAIRRWLKLREGGITELDTSGWSWPPSPSDPDIALDSQGRHWLAWTEDSYRSVVVSPMDEQGLSAPPRVLHGVGAKREVSSPRIVRGLREDLVVWREYNGKTKRDTRDSSLFSLPLLPRKPAGKPTRITVDREVMSYDVIDTGQGPVVFWSSGMSTRSTHLAFLGGGDAGPEVKLPLPRGEMAVPLGREILVLGYDASGLAGQPRRALRAAIVALPRAHAGGR